MSSSTSHLTHSDVLFVNQIDGSQTGGFTGYETDKPTYLKTIAPTYLRSHFYHTFCAEAANCVQLAAAVRDRGLTVTVLDGLLLDVDVNGLGAKMLQHRAKVYYFTLFHSSYFAVLSLIRAMREADESAVVVVGGNYATLIYRELLETVPEIDYVLVGEADISTVELAQVIIDGGQVADVAGLAYREPVEGASDIIAGARFRTRLTPANVPHIDDVLPFARDYAEDILKHEFSFSMISSRGCGLGTCTFCYLPEYQNISNIPRWRGKSPRLIIDEMEDLRDTYGVDHITFVDEDFIGPKKEGTERIVEFAEQLIERKTNMTWYANALVLSVFHLYNKGHLQLLAESGLRYLFVGIESGSEHILRRFKKGFTIAKLKKVVAALDEVGIKINPGLITFLPESTPDEVAANIDVVALIRYYDVFVFTRRLVMLPGTEEGCGCAATDADEEVAGGWAIPDKEYMETLAVEVDIDPNEYFEVEATRYLYVGLNRYRDIVFDHYDDLMKQHEKFKDCHRNYLIAQHFRFFYDLYEQVQSGQINTFAAAADFAESRVPFIDVERDATLGEDINDPWLETAPRHVFEIPEVVVEDPEIHEVVSHWAS